MEAAVDRFDGRTATQLRTCSYQLGLLANADGSAQVEQGFTSVVASVFGPKPAGQRSEQFDRALLEVKWKPRHKSEDDIATRKAEHFIRSVLESIAVLTARPRTAITITLQVLFEGGSSLACGLNAACLALADAGIALHSMCAATCCSVPPNGPILLDCTAEEESAVSSATACVAFAVSANLADSTDTSLECQPWPIGLVTHGRLTEGQLDNVIHKCKSASTEVGDSLRTALVKRSTPAD